MLASAVVLVASPTASDDSVIVQVEEGTDAAAGFDLLAPGAHDLTVTLQALGVGNEIVESWAWSFSIDVIWEPEYIGQQQLEHVYTAYGLLAEDNHAALFEGEALLSSDPDLEGWFTVSTTYLDLDADGQADDEQESTTGTPVPITRPGTTTFPETIDEEQAPGHPLWLDLDSNSQPGELTFTVTGSGAAVYGYDWELGEYVHITAPIAVEDDEIGSFDSFELHTNDNFTGPVTIEARFDPATGATDAADVVKVFPVPPSIQRDEDGGGESYKALNDDQSVPGKKLRDALPGQKINLKFNLKVPPARTVENYTWDIDGVVFKNWEAHQTIGRLTPMAADDLNDQTVHFYWTNGGEHEVKVTATLDDDSTLSKTESFNIESPTITFGVDGDIGVTAKGERILGNDSYPAIGLFSTGGTRIGFPNPGGTPSYGPLDDKGGGIVWTGQVTMPTGWPSTSGRWNWVQLVTSDRYYTTNSGTELRMSGNGMEYLDTTYPYAPDPHPMMFSDPPGAYETGDDPDDVHKGADTPHIFDAAELFKVIRIGDDRFRTWLMFRPPGDNSRYVPTKHIVWHWGGKMSKTAGMWGMATDTHQSRTSALDSPDHPTWTDNIDNHKDAVENENPTITVTFAIGEVTEGDGVINNQATVSVPSNVAADLTITLTSSDPNRLVLGLGTVTIGAGNNSAGFSFAPVDNNIDDGDKTILVFGTAADYTSGNGSILVKDNDE